MEQNKQGLKDQSAEKGQQQAGQQQNVQQTSQQSGQQLNRGLGQQEQLQQTNTGGQQLQSDREQSQDDKRSGNLGTGRENVGLDENLESDTDKGSEGQGRSGNLPKTGAPESQGLDR